MRKNHDNQLPRCLQAAATIPTSLNLTGLAEVDLTAAAEGGAPGKQPTFVAEAYTGGILRTEGFGLPVVVDLAGLRAAEPVTVLRDHDRGQIVGQTTKVDISAKRIRAAGVITGDVSPGVESAAAQVVLHSKNGFRWPVSIGVGIDKLEAVGERVSVQVNGKKFQGPLYVLRAGVLREISFVGIGADEGASATIAASAAKQGESNMTFSEWLKAKGFGENESTLTDGQKTFFQAAYDAEYPPNPAAAPAAGSTGSPRTVAAAAAIDLTASREAVAADVERIAAIRTVYSGRHAKLEAQAIRDGWDKNRAELEAMRADRPAAPAIHAGGDSAVAGTVLEAAACMSGNLAGVEKQYDEPTLTAAHKRFKGRLGLQELLAVAAALGGFVTGSVKRDVRGVLQAAFGQSTIDISGLLSNVANKFVLAGFTAVEQIWRRICAVRNVSDFKTNTYYRLTASAEYEQVGPGGEIKHGTLGEESYTNKADTYGKILAITRADIINDDLSALSDTPRKLGRGGGQKLNKVFWTKFLDNAAFFTGARGNYISGATTTLTHVGLVLALKAFRAIKDADGNPTGLTPQIILVPSALEADASDFYLSTNVNTGGSATTAKVPNRNTWAGKFRPEVSAFLDNSAYSGYSPLAWYLLANPAEAAVIDVAFLNGQESPTIETAQADFNVLGIQLRGYHDFGVALAEYRAGLMSKGAA